MPPTPTVKTVVQRAAADARALMRHLAEQYGLKDRALPERFQVKLAHAAKQPELEALQLIRSALEKFQIYCLAAWANGKAVGPDTPQARERAAKRAEALARLLETKGQKGARKMRRRAERLRAAAVPTPSPEENTP